VEEVLFFEVGFDGFVGGGVPVYIGPFGLEISQLFVFTEGDVLVFAILALPSFNSFKPLIPGNLHYLLSLWDLNF
jgi:hypothetical protein